jgi:predicted ATPase
VLGEAGLGKTRLVEELERWCVRQGIATASPPHRHRPQPRLRRPLEATQTGERYLEAELHRLRGERLLAAAAQGSDTGEAEQAIQHALDVARLQGARLLELRAAISLVRCRAASGPPKLADARRILEHVLETLPEPPHATELEQAQELLRPSG